MRFEREQCLDLDAAFARTWLLADGRGAFASGCVLGCPASRHHGLLVAPVGDRLHVLLERLDEWLVEGDRALPISTARFPGVVEPSGHTYLASFDAWPQPTWRYLVGDVEVVRTVRLLEGPGHGVEVRWQVNAPSARGRRLKLRVRPFLACRPADALTYENPHADTTMWRLDDGVRLRPYASLPEVTLRFGAQDLWAPDPMWHRRYEHVQDAHAWHEAHEDHLGLGVLEMDVGSWRSGELTLTAHVAGERADITALGAPRPSGRPRLRCVLREAARRHAIGHPLAAEQLRATLPWEHAHVVPDWPTLTRLWPLLGEPYERWVRAWAIPSGPRTSEGHEAWVRERARSFLEWALAVLRPHAPERRGAGGPFAPERMARDMTELLLCGDSEDGVQAFPLLPGRALPNEGPYHLEDAVHWLALGTALARRGPVSSRRLWCARLPAMRRAFRDRLWLADEGRPAVAWSPETGHDRGFRPELLVAAAEPAVPLTKAERASIVECARRELLTPRGLRTLSPRDAAYDPNPGPRAPQAPGRRNGAVEPRWLLPYAQATLLVHGRTAAVKKRLRTLVEGFEPHLEEHGLGCVAEVFDGQPPHRASGAPSDAHSLTALLEILRLVGEGRR